MALASDPSSLTFPCFALNIRTVIRFGPILQEKVAAVQRILNGDTLTSHGNVAGRQAMVAILEAGLRAADPTNTRDLLQVDGPRLVLDNPGFEPKDAPPQVRRSWIWTRSIVSLSSERVKRIAHGVGL